MRFVQIQEGNYRYAKAEISYSQHVIEPYQYDIALNYMKRISHGRNTNNLIETYLVLKLIKKRKMNFLNLKYLISKFQNDISMNFPISIFEIDYDSIDIL